MCCIGGLNDLLRKERASRRALINWLREGGQALLYYSLLQRREMGTPSGVGEGGTRKRGVELGGGGGGGGGGVAEHVLCAPVSVLSLSFALIGFYIHESGCQKEIDQARLEETDVLSLFKKYMGIQKSTAQRHTLKGRVKGNNIKEYSHYTTQDVEMSRSGYTHCVLNSLCVSS